MPITWTGDLDTGIDVIDTQHRRIVDYINRLEDAIERHDAAAVGPVLEELGEYCRSHFAFEEGMQVHAGYKFAEAHRATHEIFAKRLAKYQDRYNAGEDVAKLLHGMLGTWLIHHIKRDDMDYVAEVRGGMDKIAKDGKSEDWLSKSVAGFFGTKYH